MMKRTLVVVALVFAPACSGRSAGHHGGSEDARADAGMNVDAAGDAAEDAALPPLNVTLEVAREQGQRALFAVVPGQGRILLRPLPEPVVCVAARTRGPGDTNSYLDEWEVACEPGSEALPIVVRDNHLVVAKQPEIELGPRQRVTLDTTIRGQERDVACAADSLPVTVDAKLALRFALASTYSGEARQLMFRVPSLGVRVPVFGIHRPESCGTESSPTALSFGCSSMEAGSEFTAEVQGGILTLQRRFTNYGEDHVSLIGAVRLPCGAQMRCNRLDVRDPEWTGMTGKARTKRTTHRP